MRPGELNRLITLQNRTETTDGFGGPVHTWSDVATVWAKILPLSGRELTAAMAAQNQTTIRFFIRYRTDVDQSMRIVYGGKNYNITAVIDTEGKHEELQILASTGLNEG